MKSLALALLAADRLIEVAELHHVGHGHRSPAGGDALALFLPDSVGNTALDGPTMIIPGSTTGMDEPSER